MKRIGVTGNYVTGNYGMGKSAALDAFRELGAAVISTDEVVAELLEEGPVLEKIRAAFGGDVFMPDGRIDKKALADIIFSDAEQKGTLEDILHPLVFDRVEARIRELSDRLEELAGGARGGAVFIEVPLIFEGGYEDRFDKIITVYCDESLALARLEEAGVEKRDAAMRLSEQMPIEEKIRRSDFTIDNNGMPSEIRKRARYIYDVIKEEPA
jgi:dephospho-CoA kinase